MRNDIRRRQGLSEAAISAWVIIGIVAGVAAYIYAFEQLPSSVAYNAQQCAVYGYEADCKTPLK